jgi:hypothetical protein
MVSSGGAAKLGTNVLPTLVGHTPSSSSAISFRQSSGANSHTTNTRITSSIGFQQSKSEAIRRKPILILDTENVGGYNSIN